MKVKILIVPLALVISLALMIWLVYPAYSNLRVQQKLLTDKNLQVSDLDQKNQKVKELMSSLSANSEKQSAIMKFLPSSQKEEDIIGNLNEIASQSEVSVSSITVSKPKIEKQTIESVAASIPPTPSMSQVGLTDKNGSSKAATQNKAKIIKFQAEFSLYGNYEKIKNVISKVYNLNRFNRVVKLGISHLNTANAKEGQGIPDNLQADLELEFNYLEMQKIETLADINNNILSTGKFDMAVIDEIQKNKITSMSDIRLDSAGKNNPFLP